MYGLRGLKVSLVNVPISSIIFRIFIIVIIVKTAVAVIIRVFISIVIYVVSVIFVSVGTIIIISVRAIIMKISIARNKIVI